MENLEERFDNALLRDETTDTVDERVGDLADTEDERFDEVLVRVEVESAHDVRGDSSFR